MATYSRRQALGMAGGAAFVAATAASVTSVTSASAEPLPGQSEPPGQSDEFRAYACRQDIHPQDPDYPGVHVASLVKAPNGDLLYSFYAGSREGADDVKTYMSRLRVGSKEWQAPRVVFDEPNKPDGNAVLWADGDTTYLFFSTIRGGGWTDADLRLIRSADSGYTWSQPEWVRHEWGWLFGTRPFRMSNGEVIVPIYSENRWAAGWYIPADDYSTWIPYPSADDAEWPRSPNGAIQPATVELDPGHLLAYLRTRDGLIYRTESFDYGRTWTPALPTSLPNNNARVALLKLDSGKLLLAYNPLTAGRHVLRLALSSDNAQTWGPGVNVEAAEPGTEFSYPYLLQTGDGMVQLGYTHRRETMRHLVFNEAFVSAGEDLPSDPSYSVWEYRHGELDKVSKSHYVNTPR